MSEEKRCCEPQALFFCDPHDPPDAPPPPLRASGPSPPPLLSPESARNYERAYADASRPPTADELLRLPAGESHGPAADHGEHPSREMRYTTRRRR